MRCETILVNGRAKLTTYLWDESEELAIRQRPAVLVFPGGGYYFCSDREAEPVALGYMAEGFNVFVLRYTTVKRFEPAFEDAKAALTLIRQHAAAWGTDPRRIAVCGFSAGGHLACAMGVMAEEKPNAMVLVYPAVLGKTWEPDDGVIPNLIPHVRGDAAPAFLFHTVDDTVVPVRGSLELMTALSGHHVSYEAHLYPTGEHGLSLARAHCSGGREAMVSQVAAAWFGQSVRWLKEVLGEVTLGEPLPHERLIRRDE